MNWKLVLPLGGFGLAMGVASVLGETAGIEVWLWLAIYVICAAVLAWRAPGQVWLHGFFVGLLSGATAPLIQALFFSTYLANNPGFQRSLADIPGGLEPRWFILTFAPVAGLLSGLVLGTVAWATTRLVSRRAAAAQQGDAPDGASRRR